MTEEEIKKLQQEKEEALSKVSALQDELEKEKNSHKELKSKYDKLVEDSDQLRLLNGKLLLQQTKEDEDDKGSQEEQPPKSLEEEVIDILNMK